MRDFGASAVILGNLSAFYFYPYAALQIPIGLWIDRWGPRRSLTLACSVVALGCFVFASSTSLHSAYLGRFLIGTGCAFSWPGLLAVVHQWFPHRFAILAGVGQMIGMVGAVCGQGPLAAAVQSYGWRTSLFALCLFGGCLSVLLGIILRDRRQPGHGTLHPWTALTIVGRNKRTWFSALFGLSLATQILAFGGLWGVPFISGAYGLERTAAANIVSLVFVGSAFGAVSLGWWSDRRSDRRTTMITAGSLCLVCDLMVIGVSGWSIPVLCLWVFGLGVGTGGIALAFATARDHNPHNVSGLAIGIVNTGVMASGAILQLLIGFILDITWRGEVVEGVRVYATQDYQIALLPLPLVVLCGLWAARRL